MSERIADVIKGKTEELIGAIAELTPPVEGSSEEDNRQFIVGFVHMLEQAARGNLEPRVQYLTGVIPAIKAAGMPATIVFSGMVQVAMGVAAFFAQEREVLNWATAFCSAYTADLVTAYEA